MAQILKYESGGTSEKPKTIKRGEDEIELSRYIRNLEGNFDNWLSTRKGLKKDQKAQVRNAYRELIKGLVNGVVVPELGNQASILDRADTYKNTEEGFDPYGTAYDYLNTVLQKQQVYTAKDSTSSDKLAWDPNKGISQALSRRLFNGRDSYDDNFLLVDDDYNEETGKRGIAKRWALVDQALNGIENDYNLTDEQKQNLLSNIQRLREAYTNDQSFTDNEQLVLSNLGLNDKWFYTGKNYVKAEEANQSDVDKRFAEVQKDKEDQAKWDAVNARDLRKQLMAMTNSNIRDFSSVLDYRTPLDSDWVWQDDQAKSDYYDIKANRGQVFADYSLSDDLFNGRVGSGWNTNRTKYQLRNGKDVREYSYFTDDYNGLSDSQKILATQKAYALDWLESLDDTDKSNRKITSTRSGKYRNWYVIDNDVNDDSGYVTIIDPKANYIGRIPVADIISTAGYNNYLDRYIQRRIEKGLVASHKEGGILKAQFGDTLPRETISMADLNSHNKERITKQNKEKEDALNNAIKHSGKSKEDYLNDKKEVTADLDNWTGSDVARATAIGLDIASMLSAYVPVYGTAASAVTGLGATFTNLGADIAQGESAWDAGKAFLTGVGLDAIGLIPGLGTAGKTGKIIKNLIKLAPKLMGVITLFDDDVQKSFKKVFSEEKLTTEDWRNVAHGLQALAGLHNSGVIAAKRAANRSAITEYGGRTEDGTTNYLKTKNGTLEVGEGPGKISKANFEKIQKAKSLKEQNEILQSLPGQENNSLRGTYRGMLPKVNQRARKDQFITKEGDAIYDFSVLDGQKPYNLFGIEYNPFGNSTSKWTDAWFYNNFLNGGVGAFQFSNPFTWGLNRRTASPVANPVQNSIAYVKNAHPNAGSGPNPNSIMSWRTPGQARTKAGVTMPDGSVQRYGRDYALGGAGKTMIDPDTGELLVLNKYGLWLPLDREGGKIDLLKYRNGGQVSKFQGGGTPGRTITNTSGTAQWYDDIYKTQAMLDWLGRYNTSNYKEFNDLQDRWFDNYTNTKYTPNATTATYNQGVWDRQGNFNKAAGGINTQITSLVNSGKIKTVGQTGDNANSGYQDGYFGAQEYLRHGGMRSMLSDQDVTQLNESLKSRGLQYIFDSTNNMGHLELLPTDNSPSNPPAINDPTEDPTDDPIKDPEGRLRGVHVEGESNEYTYPRFGWAYGLYPQSLGIRKLLNTSGGNRWIRDTLYSSIKYPLQNTYERYSPVTGDFGDLKFYNMAAEDVRRTPARQATSDASLAYAKNQDANLKAIELEERGHMTGNAKIEQSKKEKLARTEDNMARRSALANTNTGAIYKTNRERAQLLADYKLKQTNVNNNFLTELQQDAKDMLGKYQNYQYNSAELFAYQKYKDAVEEAREALYSVRQAHKNDPTFDITKHAAWRTYKAAMRAAEINYNNEKQKAMGDIFGWGYSPYKSSNWYVEV